MSVHVFKCDAAVCMFSQRSSKLRSICLFRRRGLKNLYIMMIDKHLWLLSIIFFTIGFSNYTYNLQDINPNSHTQTYGNFIGPEYFSGQITIHYFGKQT